MAIQNSANTGQKLDSSSSPTFNGLTLTNPLTVANGGTTEQSFTANNVILSGTTSTGSCSSIGGSANQVVVSAGGSAYPAFGDYWGRMVALSSQTANNSASIVFKSFDLTYSYYVLRINNMIPVTTNTSVNCTCSTDNGSTYLNTGYYNAEYYNGSDGGHGGVGSANDSKFVLITEMNNASANPLTHVSNFFNINNGSITLRWFGNNYSRDAGTAIEYRMLVAGGFTSASAVTALKIAMSSGNISSGTFVLYGVKDDY